VFVEVTNTLAVPYQTGFQRHTREILRRLPGPDSDGPIRFVPVKWCQECNAYRRLTEPEAQLLDHFVPPATPPQSTLSRLARPVPDPVADLVRTLAKRPRVHRIRVRASAWLRARNHSPEHTALRINRWPEDAWLFDLEAAWHNAPHRSIILPRLHSEGVRTSTLIADVMPTQFPQWFDAGQIQLFSSFIDAHVEYSEKFLCISKCSERDVIDYAERTAPDTHLDTSLITIGGDFRSGSTSAARPASAPAGRYLLSVGTVEPRKNHGFLLDAFDQLSSEYPDLGLVFVGMAGWMTGSTIERFERHPEFGKRFRWLGRTPDDELDALYEHAFLAVQPALYEGFGAPVAEALARGIPTLSSNGGALPEAGGDRAEYFDPQDLETLIVLLRRHLDDESHHQEMRDGLIGYVPPTWADAAAGVLAAFQP
jgi:glycosyltransferase involved in cell wall biosynthesis